MHVHQGYDDIWLTSEEPHAKFFADRLRLLLKEFGRLGVTYGQVALESYLVLAGKF
jgi:hypothetical protein